jgi:hypothetical protein
MKTWRRKKRVRTRGGNFLATASTAASSVATGAYNAASKVGTIFSTAVNSGLDTVQGSLETLQALSSAITTTATQTLEASKKMIKAAAIATSEVGVAAFRETAQLASAGLGTFNRVGQSALTEGAKVATAGLTSLSKTAENASSLTDAGTTALASMGQAAALKGTAIVNAGTEQGAAVSVATVQATGKIATEAISIVENSMNALLQTVSGPLIAFNKARQIAQDVKSTQEDILHRKAMQKAFSIDFSSNIRDLIKNLKSYVKAQSNALQVSIPALKQRNCKKGRLYGYSCDPDSLPTTLVQDLASVQTKTLQKIMQLDSLRFQANTALHDLDTSTTTNLKELDKEAGASLVSLYSVAKTTVQSVFDAFRDLIAKAEPKMGGTRKRVFSRSRKAHNFKRRNETTGGYHVPAVPRRRKRTRGA